VSQYITVNLFVETMKKLGFVLVSVGWQVSGFSFMYMVIWGALINRLLVPSVGRSLVGTSSISMQPSYAPPTILAG